tara:strand:+ start:6695 stop:8416 length:1722 start_codon:yes stop_codon:yes gene_type:complete
MEKINKLKSKFKEYNVDGYLIPKNDEFFNEYVPHHKDDLQYISNFSGSYGLALILKKNNFLFVDGRYTVQANLQSGKNFKILTLPLIRNQISASFKNKVIGFDPRLFNEEFIQLFSKKLGIRCISLNNNLIKLIKEKKIIPKKRNYFYVLDKSVTGKSCQEKLKNLKTYIKKNSLDIMLITSSENVAWLLNIRGRDSNFSPIPNCFLLVDKQMNVFLFCDLKKIDIKFRKKLNFITVLKTNELDNFLYRINNKNFLIDKSTCSIFYKNIIKKNNNILRDTDPIYFYKSQKNKVEINNTKKIHEFDGASLTKFLFWIQNNYKKKKITELTAQKKLLSFKKKYKQFKFLSFPTISSTGPNGAIVHYNATKKTNMVLKVGNIYLVDSGGQYQFGTTDVTRTISLDTKSKKIKEVFTKVLQGHLNLSNYKITKNTTGSVLDKIARKKLKKINLDYAHGTGHGVGYFLNVHEGPHSISKFNKIKLKSGMIVSNEPGYYEKGKYGIRIENLIYITKNNKVMKFNNLTYAPIDKNLIIKELLNKQEKIWLNNYHRLVYKKLKKYMNKRELVLLKKSCSNI